MTYQQALDAFLAKALQQVIPEVATDLLLHICRDTDLYREAVRIGETDETAVARLEELEQAGELHRLALSLRVSLIEGLRAQRRTVPMGGAFEKLAVVANGGN